MRKKIKQTIAIQLNRSGLGPIGKIRDHIQLYSDPAPSTLPGTKELIVPPFAFEFNALRPLPN